MYKKHCLAEKQHAVELYESGHGSDQIGLQLGVNSREIRRWLRSYATHGARGLQPQRPICPTPEFKRQVVADVLEESLSLESAALKHGVSCSAVRSWVKQVRAQGYDSLQLTKPRGRPRKNMGRPKKQEPQTELEKLQAENEYLRAENALLKKVRALVEERIARESGKKRTPSKD